MSENQKLSTEPKPNPVNNKPVQKNDEKESKPKEPLYFYQKGYPYNSSYLKSKLLQNDGDYSNYYKQNRENTANDSPKHVKDYLKYKNYSYSFYKNKSYYQSSRCYNKRETYRKYYNNNRFDYRRNYSNSKQISEHLPSNRNEPSPETIEDNSFDFLNCSENSLNTESKLEKNHKEKLSSPTIINEKEIESTKTDLDKNDQHPRISVKPLSDLVYKEIVYKEEPGVNEIVNRIAKMDKRSIQKVINDPNSKFNEALMVKHQQLLRDAVRKQLESMCQNQKKPTENNNFEIETDAIVDSVYLPEILYDQIRDAYGMDIFDNTKETCKKQDKLLENESTAMNSTTNQNEIGLTKQEASIEASLNVSIPKSQDLMTRIRNSELVKSKSDRRNCERNQNSKDFGDNSPKTDDVSSSSQTKEVPSPDKTQNNNRTVSVSSRSNENNKSTKNDTDYKKLSSSTSSSTKKSNRSRHDGETKSKSHNNSKDIKKNDASKRLTSEDDVMIINSSSESSSSGSDSSSSDSDSSSSSHTSSSNSIDLKAKKKKSLEDSVIENFKHLIFSSLKPALQKRFNNKKTKTDELNFIADHCLPVIKKQKLLESNKIKNFKNDLNSIHNESCLKTLLHSMLSIYHKDKRSKPTRTKETSSYQSKRISQNKSFPKPIAPDLSLKEPNSKNHNEISDKSVKKVTHLLTETLLQSNEAVNSKQSQVIVPDISILSKDSKNTSEVVINESSTKDKIIEEPPPSVVPHTPLSTMNHQSSNDNLASSKETAQSASGGTLNVVADTAKDSTDSKLKSVNVSEESQTSKRLNGIVSVDNDNPNNQVIESETNSAADSNSDCDMENMMMNTCDMSNEIPERLWKSPGEKKCIENAEETTTCSITHSEQTSLLNTRFCVLNPIELANLQMLLLNQQNSFSDSVLQAINEIDLKIMKVHQNKTQIEDMILKLQKDKAEAEIQTIQLQNEKTILINTVKANLTMSITTDQLLATRNMQMASTTIANDNSFLRKRKISTIIPKKVPFSTPFSEKLRNRKKRCQRDILIEDTANAIFNDDNERSEILLSGNPELISENADDLFRITSRRTTKSLNAKASDKAKNVNDPSKDIPKTTLATPFEQSNNIPSNVEKETDETMKNSQFDYAIVEPGCFEQSKFPISHIKVIDKWVLAASEDGSVYKFNILTKNTESKFIQHTKAITSLFVDSKNFVYTTSLDGYFKTTLIENFGLGLQSINVKEPLQTAEYEWDTVFIGSRKGNVFTYDVLTNKLSSIQLCNINNSILAMKATKEGPRKILIISSRGNDIEIRDALCGILLRSFSIPENLCIHSMVLKSNYLYCGTQLNLILKFDFSSGNLVEKQKSGNGAVSMKQHNNKDIYVGCYDGFVYVYGASGLKGKIAGSGKMILSLEIAGNKIITSSKDNIMQLLDIPQFLLINKLN